MSDGTDSSGRDGRGRFTKGNPGGPGGARKRPFELREAAQRVVTPEVADALVRKAVRLGLEGNLAAIRFLFEHTGGRPGEAPVAPAALDVPLPPLRTAADCAVAIDIVIQARVDGRIASPDAQMLNDLIATRLKAIEAEEHEQRLAELEIDAARNASGSPRQN